MCNVCSTSTERWSTILPQNIEVSTVLERDFPQDVLIEKSSSKEK